jgi:HTH-type transcriptional regulator/antitoxin HigA
MLRVIKTKVEYETALGEIARLAAGDPRVGGTDGDRLELLTLLVEDYEERVVPKERPRPIEAVRFRMDQLGLSQKDLVPFIGSRSKVSEVLSGKRLLTLAMIRALHRGLDIPAEVLLEEHDPADLDGGDVDWQRFPLREMVRRGWIRADLDDARDRAEELLRAFFRPLGEPRVLAPMYRRTRHVRSARTMDPYALTAWVARLCLRARETRLTARFQEGSITCALMREVTTLSWSEQGPRLAREFLAANGITLLVEPHLPRTHLDGAALLLETHRPVVGLTLRHDRVDNFWFCLLHELAHLQLHLAEGPGRREVEQFIDDLDSGAADDPREQEADRAAGEALVPSDDWKASPASRLRTPEAARSLAAMLRIHPAIVAGKVRHESRSFRVLSQLVGQGEVRKLFPEVSWECSTTTH